MRDPGQASSVLLRGLVRASGELGVDRYRLLEACGISDVELDHDGGVSLEVLYRAWQAAPALSGDPLFGLHAGQHSELGDYDIVDYLFATSATLGAACESAARYFRILSELANVRLVVGDGRARFQHLVQPALADPLRHAWDCFFSGAIKRVHAVTSAPFSFLHVALMHDGAGHPEEYRRVFGAEVRFSEPIGELVIEARLLDTPLVGANAKLHRVLRRHADQLLARVPSSDDVVGRARAMIEERLHDADISLSIVAKRLGVSNRSLQRRLDEHGVRFRDLVDAVREERATRRIENPNLTLSELAEELGFSSLAAFHRAFVRWHGVPPGVYRSSRASGLPVG
jgi:AraC-like DNA-binding protein